LLHRASCFFAVVTDKAIPRGSFASVKEFVAKINHFVAHYTTRGQTLQVDCHR
jgi:hypothetical protein